MDRRKLIPLLIVGAGFLTYHNSFTGPFILDDKASIPENLTIRQLWPAAKMLSPPASTGVAGRPVFNLTLAINYALGELRVGGYHVLNLAIHILAGLTLFGIVRRTLLRERFEAEAAALALAVAVIWVVHPLQTEAVTYVSQRSESLMGLFYLLTMYGFVRGMESPRQGWWFALSVGACALGMATKEVMVTAPVMVLLYDRTFVSGSFREAWTKRWRFYAGLAATWILLAVLLSSLTGRGVGYHTGVTWWEYALTECRAIVWYLKLAIWPGPLVFDYGSETTKAVAYALIVLLLAGGTGWALWRRPKLGFAGAWFFVILAPTSSVVPIAGQPMAEHRMYLPLAVVVLLMVLGIQAVAGRRSMDVLFVVALGLGFLTVQRNEDYRSELALWHDTVAKCPNNPRAHDSLATALSEAGDWPQAIRHWEQALRIKPDDARAHGNLGVTLWRGGRVPEAVGHLEAALRIEPDFVDAQYNLGSILSRLGKLDEAVRHYEEAVRIDPNHAMAHNNLGSTLMRQGKVSEAAGHFEQAVRIRPDYAEAHYNLGIVLEQAGRVREAVQHYEEALRLKPDSVEIRNKLAALHEGR